LPPSKKSYNKTSSSPARSLVPLKFRLDEREGPLGLSPVPGIKLVGSPGGEFTIAKTTGNGESPEAGLSVGLGGLGTDFTKTAGEVSPASPLPEAR